jgi:hypothetical protein
VSIKPTEEDIVAAIRHHMAGANALSVTEQSAVREVAPRGGYAAYENAGVVVLTIVITKESKN